jgi:large subunit ribosomal protein L15
MPLARRLPKRGFRNPLKVPYQVVSLARLGRFARGAVVDEEALRRERIVKGRGPIKILSDGDVAQALTVRVAAVSAKAREKILAAGGTVESAGP